MLGFAIYADLAQLVEHILGKDEVTGSNPVISSKGQPHDLFWSWGFWYENNFLLFTFSQSIEYIYDSVPCADIRFTRGSYARCRLKFGYGKSGVAVVYSV